MRSFLILVVATILTACGGDTTEPPPAPTGPAAPQNLVAVAGTGKVLLSWDAVAGAQSYNLYWTDDGAAPSKSNGNRITGPESPFTHANRANNTEYKYVITARDAEGEGAESAVVSATPGVGPLPAPEELRAGVDDGQLVLSWDDVSLASTYNLYWTDDGSAPTTSSSALAGVTSPYTHTGLTNGTAYKYIVATASAAGEGPVSNVASATPTAGPFIGTVSLQFQVCNADCCDPDDSVGYAWWIEDAAGNYLDTVVYYAYWDLYANAAMPVWDAANGDFVDGFTEASVYNDDIKSHVWDGRDRNGSRLPYGTYTMRMEMGDWDLATDVTDVDLTLGADGPTGNGTGANSLTCAGLTYTYTP